MLATLLVTSLFTAPIAAAALQADPHVETPNARSEKTASELFEEAARRLDTVTSFVLKYAVDANGKPGSMELAYAAPDRAWAHCVAEGTDMQMWIVDGRLSLRGRAEDGPMSLDFDFIAESILRGEFERAICAELPDERAPDPQPTAGATIQFGFTPGEGSGREIETKLNLGWSPRRRHAMSWGDGSTWGDARVQGDFLVRDVSPTVIAKLSIETGVLQEVRGEKGALHLVECRIDEPVDAKTFDVPDPDPKATDRSAEFRRLLVSSMREVERRQLYHLASRAIDASGGDESRWRSRVANALGAYHAEAERRTLAPWLEKMRATMDDYFASANEHIAADPSNEKRRGTIAASATEWRMQLVELLDKTSSEYADDLPALDSNTQHIAYGSAIAAVERAVAHEAFVQSIAGPLLARFDEALQSTLSPR